MKKSWALLTICIPKAHLLTLILFISIPSLAAATGVFKPGWELPGEVETKAVVLADADGDGDDDAWVLRTTQLPVILSNDGTGILVENGIYFGTRSSIDFVIGDVDGDNDQDALLISQNDRAHIWLNNGSAQFTVSTQQLGSTYISLGSTLADVDGDGDLDALLKNINSQFEIWVNNGSGTFIYTGNMIGDAATTHYITLGDLDQDGDLDAWVVRDVTPSSNRIWTNDGNGIFTDSGVEYGPTDVIPYTVAMGDIDGDLDVDVLAAYCCQNSGATQMSDIIWRNDGTGVFSEEATTLNLGSSAQLIDLNGDGFLDAASGNNYVLNDTAGNFTGASQFFDIITSAHAAFADLTDNGASDLYRGVTGKDTVWFNDGLANFTDSGQRFGVYHSTGFDLGDVDTDGDLDIWMVNSNVSPNGVWLNDGDGNFSDTGQELGANISFAVDLGDLDGDGDLDAWVANYVEPSSVWLNDGSGNYISNGQALTSGLSSYMRDVALGDLDGDGDLDAWVALFFDPDAIWLNNGSGIFSDSGQSLSVPSASDISTSVALGDLDGDGDLDAWLGFWGPNQIWLNDGSGGFTNSLQNLGSYTTYDIELADVDGDLDLDAFTANSGPNKVWLNDGSGIFTDSGQAFGDSISVNVDLGDVNNDGFIDAWVANSNSEANKVWINNGAGVFQDSQQSLGASWSRDVKLGDVDGDLKIDALVINRYGDHLAWINMDNHCSIPSPLLNVGPYTGQVYCGAGTKITAGPLIIEAGADVTFFAPLIELISDFSVKNGGTFGAGNSPLVDP